MNEAINSYMEETLDFSSQTPAMQAALTKFFESALGQYVLSNELGDMFSPYRRSAETKLVAPRFFQARFTTNKTEYSLQIRELGEDAVTYSFTELNSAGVIFAQSHNSMSEDAFYTKCQQLLNKLVPTPVLDKQTLGKLPDLNRPGVSKVMRDTITRLCATPFGRYALKTGNAQFRTPHTLNGEPINTGYLNFSFIIPIGDRSLVFHVENGLDVSNPTVDQVWLSYCFSELDPEIDAYIAYRAGTSVDEEFLIMEMEHAYGIIVNNWINEQHAKVGNIIPDYSIESIVDFLLTPIGQWCFLKDHCELTWLYRSRDTREPVFMAKVPVGDTVYRFTIKYDINGETELKYDEFKKEENSASGYRVVRTHSNLTKSYFNDLGTLALHAIGKHSTNITTADYI